MACGEALLHKRQSFVDFAAGSHFGFECPEILVVVENRGARGGQLQKASRRRRHSHKIDVGF